MEMMSSAPTSPSARAPFLVPPGSVRRKRRHVWLWVVGFFAVLAISMLLVARYMISKAQPILRARVIETLSTRFKTKVELDGLDVSIANGLHVSGKGLRIFGPTDPNPSAALHTHRRGAPLQPYLRPAGLGCHRCGRCHRRIRKSRVGGQRSGQLRD